MTKVANFTMPKVSGAVIALHVLALVVGLQATPAKFAGAPVKVNFMGTGPKGGGARTVQRAALGKKAEAPVTAKKAVAAATRPKVKEEKEAQEYRPGSIESLGLGGTGKGNGKGNSIGDGIGDGGSGTSDAKALYVSKVATLIAQRKHYPSMARRLGHQGEVLLNLTLDKNGKLVAMEVVKDSPYSSLNQATIDMIEGVGSFPPIPEEVGMDKISFQVPVNYKLVQ